MLRGIRRGTPSTLPYPNPPTLSTHSITHHADTLQPGIVHPGAMVRVHKRRSARSAERKLARQWPTRPEAPFCHTQDTVDRPLTREAVVMQWQVVDHRQAAATGSAPPPPPPHTPTSTESQEWGQSTLPTYTCPVPSPCASCAPPTCCLLCALPQQCSPQTCNCGSIIRGQRVQFVTMDPFSIDTRSAGRPWLFQSATCETSCQMPRVAATPAAVHRAVCLSATVVDWRDDSVCRCGGPPSAFSEAPRFSERAARARSLGLPARNGGGGYTGQGQSCSRLL